MSDFDNAARQFERTTERLGRVERRARIGSRVVRFRLAGSQLASTLLPAVEHLERLPAAEPPDLTIDVWESRESPIRLSKQDWARSVSPLEVLGPRDFVYCQPDIGMLILLRASHALVCYRDLAAIPPWELAIPFRVVLNSWFQYSGGQLIHGAAVADSRYAVILAGAGGAGKSSTALSCLEHPELLYMADDLCLLQHDRQPFVHSLYNSIKIRRENLSRFADMELPDLDHLPLDYGKPTFFLHPKYQQKLALRRPLRAILLPRIIHESRTRIVPATPADAWRALVPSTFAVVMGDRKATARNIHRLTRGVPVSWLELGVDRRQIASEIHRFLGQEARQVA